MPEINYVALAIASFIFAVTPGPGIVAVLATSIRRGTGAGVFMSLGEVCGDMVYLLIAIGAFAGISRGLGADSTVLANIMVAVRICGGGYLIWLGIRQMRMPPLQVQSGSPGSLRGKGFGFGVAWATGFMISITNPKVIVFYLSFLPLFIDLTRIDFETGVRVMAVMFFSVLAGPLVFVAIGKKARDFASDEISGRRLNRVTGLLLVAVGIALVALI